MKERLGWPLPPSRKGTTMIETMVSVGKSGPVKPLLVEVLPADFITGTALTTLVGMGSHAARGTLMPTGDTEPWFILRDGTKVFAIPKKPLRYACGYRALESAGVIYRGKTVTIAGCVWRIGLFTGQAANSEWMRIIASLLKGSGVIPPAGTPDWGSYTYDDLGIGSANTSGQGVACYIQEPYNQYQYYTRGIKNNYNILTNQNMDNNFSTNGWRPILEYISGPQNWV